ncbi:MAG: GntP family permease [Chitinophagaceae bacterium]
MNYLPTAVIGLAIAVFVLIFLVLRTKVHPLIAMISAACIAGITGGMSVNDTLDAITKGFGSTLGTIGIVIGLGVMMGRILEVSGAAEQIAYSFIKWLGKRKEEWALALTGYFVSIPIFADSAFVILYPIAKAFSIKGNRSLLTMAVALGGGLIVTHTLVPPTPGPLGVAGIFGVDIGIMILSGMVLAIPCTIAFVWYAQWLAKRYPDFISTTTNDESLKTIHDNYVKEKAEKKLPTLTLSLLPIIVPILLILIKALISLFPSLAASGGMVLPWIIQFFQFTGSPVIALCISTLIAVYTLVPFLDRQQTAARLEEGLQSAGIILMVTGAGGALGFVVRESGAGTELAKQIAHLPFSPIMIPFLVSTVVRLIQGSATVAMITSASITAPILAEVPGVNLAFAALAATSGSFFFSYFNDSLFWVVNRMVGIKEVNLQIIAWSLPTTVAWGIGGILVAIGNLIFAKGGSLFDPLIPLLGLAIIFFIIGRKKNNTKIDALH